MTLPGQITGVHTVGVPVTDQDRAIDFYVARSVSPSASTPTWAAAVAGSRWRPAVRR